MENFENLRSYKSLKELAKKNICLNQKDINWKDRFEKFQIEIENFKLFYATERVCEKVLIQLDKLAKESKVFSKMRDMQEGQIVNKIDGNDSENRSVLHTAMRDFYYDPINSEIAKEATKFAYEEIEKLKKFLEKFSSKFTTIVQIGIGGSDLGPRALYDSLKAFQKNDKKIFFISNVDPDDVYLILEKIDLEKTLFITVSKSGTTLETLTNEEIVKKYLKKKGKSPKDHMVAVTGKGSPMDDREKYLESFYIKDYVGGRFSATSMVGAVILSFAVGIETFLKVLKGASFMDKIALRENVFENLPLFSALLRIWNRNFLNYNTVAIIPYSQGLLTFPKHLQQLEMESNGKSIVKTGKSLKFQTSSVVWGEIGTNSQHSFFQLLHQGTEIVPVEFIGFKETQLNKDLDVMGTSSNQKLLANLFAQSIALAKGEENVKNLNKNFDGNRPNNLLLAKKLDPFTIGALLSFYEHKTAFMGFIWNINSFDQEGVQLGKKLSSKFLDVLKNLDKKRDEFEDFFVKEFI